MEIISIHQNKEYISRAAEYFNHVWCDGERYDLYLNAITHTSESLPQWYLALDQDEIVGCVALLTNDFNSRMDLWPWLSALYVEETHRNRGIAHQLIDHVSKESYSKGFDALYLITDHTTFYERFGFESIDYAFDAGNEKLRVYKKVLSPELVL